MVIANTRINGLENDKTFWYIAMSRAAWEEVLLRSLLSFVYCHFASFIALLVSFIFVSLHTSLFCVCFVLFPSFFFIRFDDGFVSLRYLHQRLIPFLYGYSLDLLVFIVFPPFLYLRIIYLFIYLYSFINNLLIFFLFSLEVNITMSQFPGQRKHG